MRRRAASPQRLQGRSTEGCNCAAPRRLVRGGVRRLHAQVPLSSGALSRLDPIANRTNLSSCSRLQRCAAPPQHSPALHCAALPRKWRLRIGSFRHIARAPYGCLHRPRALQGAIDHGRDSAACGRTGDAREHPGCACTPSRAHIPAFTASSTQAAGAPAPPPPMKVEAVDDTSTPPHTAGVSTHSTPCPGRSRVPP